MKKYFYIIIIFASLYLLLHAVPKYYKVDTSKCMACVQCITVCPVDAIKIVHNKAIIDSSLCIACGRCYSGYKKYKACPFEAIIPVEGPAETDEDEELWLD